MSFNPNSPRYRRIFIQQQTSGGAYPSNYRVVNNTAGTWVNTGAQLIRAPEASVTMNPLMPITEVTWLTGTRSLQPGIGGRKASSWALENLPLIPSGSAGTIPDLDIALQNVFGQASTVSVGTSVAYSFLDTGFLPFTLFDFPHNVPTLTNRLIWGCFVTEFEIILNGNVLVMNLRGGGGYLLDSDNFSSEAATAQASLTVYPLEPSSPTYNGAIIPGFGATVTIDSQSLEQKVTSMTVRGTTGFEIIGDAIADGYPAYAVGGTRRATVSVGMTDDDSAALQDIKKKAKQQATVPYTVTIGTVAGSKLKIDGNNLQLVPNSLTDAGNRVNAQFPEAAFHASAVGQTDDIKLTFL